MVEKEMIIFDVQIYGFGSLEADLDQSEACLVYSVRSGGLFVFFSCPGRIFSYCVRARAYTHVLAHVYSTRASTCTLHTC